jgi:hypothetical protein
VRSQPLFGIILMVAGLVLMTAGTNFSRPFAVAPSFFIAGGSIGVAGLFTLLLGARTKTGKTHPV